jgi:hypothetical protein
MRGGESSDPDTLAAAGARRGSLSRRRGVAVVSSEAPDRSPCRIALVNGDHGRLRFAVTPRFCFGIQISYRLHPLHIVDLCVLLISMDQAIHSWGSIGCGVWCS